MHRRWIIWCFLTVVLVGCQPVLPADQVGDERAGREQVQLTGEPLTQTSGFREPGVITATAVMTSLVPLHIDATALPTNAENAVAADPRLRLVGMAVYRQQYCGICHELAAAETTGTFGPTHNGIGSTAALRIEDARYSGTAVTAEEYLRESIVEPSAYLVQGYAVTSHPMPPYAHLDDSEINALLAFLLAQK